MIKNKSNSKKTVLKTMRIPASINTLLEKDADSKGVSVNALLSMIMTKYAEWDRYIERFGGITIKPQALKEILEAVKLAFKYKGYARYELETDGSEYTIILVHDLGEKWSNFLRYVVESGMKSITGIVPKFEVNQDSLIVRFNSRGNEN